MFCKYCGAALEEAANHCANCGAAVEKEAPVQQPVYYAPPAPTAPPVVTNEIPEENRPLSPWAYFGLQLLFAIPIVGFVFLIVFSCNGSNINRRNFARSYWCSLIIVGAVLLFFLMIAAMGGGLDYYF